MTFKYQKYSVEGISFLEIIYKSIGNILLVMRWKECLNEFMKSFYCILALQDGQQAMIGILWCQQWNARVINTEHHTCISLHAILPMQEIVKVAPSRQPARRLAPLVSARKHRTEAPSLPLFPVCGTFLPISEFFLPRKNIHCSWIQLC